MARRLLSPVARACAIDSSRSGRTSPYRSDQRRASVAGENQAAKETQGRASAPPAGTPPATRARVARLAPTSAGSLLRTDVNAATARTSGGAADSRAAYARRASARSPAVAAVI